MPSTSGQDLISQLLWDSGPRFPSPGRAGLGLCQPSDRLLQVPSGAAGGQCALHLTFPRLSHPLTLSAGCCHCEIYRPGGQQHSGDGTRSCQGCVGLSGCSLCDTLSSIPREPLPWGKAVSSKRDRRGAPQVGGCPDQCAWRLQSTVHCLC